MSRDADMSVSPQDPTEHDHVEGVDLAVFRAYEAFFDDVTNSDDEEAPPVQAPKPEPASQEPEQEDGQDEQPKDFITRRIPDRLTSHIPPANFGAVMPGSIYRSSFPFPENFSFIKGLGLKTILTLVPEPYPQAFVTFMLEQGIRHVRVHVPANKEVVRIEAATMYKALGVILDPAYHPMLVHCNKGKHRTGCVTACLRKVTGESHDFVSHEYHTYAGAKARKLDEEFIKGFDERPMLWLARENGFLPSDEPLVDSPGGRVLVLPPKTKSGA